MRTELFRAGRAAPMVSIAVVWAACATCLSWIFWPLGNWLRYPLVYEGDALWNLFVVKTVFETGWYRSNDHLGAPFSATFLDFAKPESLYLMMFRLAGLVTSNVMLVHNLFYFLGFFLISASALLVLRNGFRLSWVLAVAGALLYAFLPFHLMRQEHLFLSNYFAVPIAVWMALLVSADNPPFFPAGRLQRAGWPVWLAAAVVASVGAYYAFFAIVLISAVGCLESIRTMLWRNAASAMLLCTLVAACLAANFTPSLLYSADQGANKYVAARALKEIDIYALQPIQLLLPTQTHRLPAFSELGRKYDAGALLVNENRTSYLGIVASVGFLLLLVTLVAGHRVIREHHNFGVAARINAIALSLAVAGGGGMLLGLLASPQFRALNRISVVIAFVSIAGLLMALQELLNRFPVKSRAYLSAAASVLLVTFGLWDQVPLNVNRNTTQMAAEFDSDRAFVRDIEASLPADSLVLQLPYTPFPEAEPRFRETLYSHLRGYLHGTTLRWSYGGMQGRKSDLWHASLAQVPLAEQIETAKSNGFRGVWLERRALKDGGIGLEARLHSLGVVDAHESIDKQLVFYSLLANGSFHRICFPRQCWELVFMSGRGAARAGGPGARAMHRWSC